MKILLIDDEPSAREIIKLMVDFEGLGFDEILEADNGKGGLELIERKNPDLIITDMKMPIMDGVSLLSTLENMENKFKVIVISGFLDYEYTRVAIKSKVVDYILKPIKSEDLTAAIKKAMSEIQLETDIMGNDSHDVFDTRFKLGKRRSISKAELEEYLEYTNFKQELDEFSLLLIKAINFEAVRISVYNGHKELMLFSIEETINSFFTAWNANVTIIPIPENHEIFIALKLKKTEYTQEKLKEGIKNLLDAISRNCSLVSIAVMFPRVESKEHILSAFRQMKHTLLYSNILSKETIFQSDKKLDRLNKIGRYGFFDKRDDFLFALKNCDEKKSEIIITKVFNEILDVGDVSISELDFIGVEYINILSDMFNSLEIDMEEFVGNDKDIIDFTIYSGKIDEFENWMKNFTKRSINYIMQVKKESCSDILGNMLKYIETYYYERINLDILSEKFFLSKSHISRIFKKELNENFVDYITKVRLKKAEKLLKDKSLKVQSISEMTGFSDVSYFSRSFKKLYKISPEEFRHQKSKSE